MGRIDWRRVNWVFHRDVGYFLTGLVVLYCVSGVAVNHVEHWNPSYSISTREVDVGPLPGGDLGAMERAVISKLGLEPGEIKGRHSPSPKEFRLFLPHGGEIKIETATGRGTLRRVKPRAVLFESNVLHLNHLKGIWTYFADIFSILLIGLAVTGLFILKGREGLAGRGKWLVGAGVILPAAFILYYHLSR